MKIRVGFGPETSANSFHQSGVKVGRLLGKDPHFECGFFREPFSYEELSRFDVLVFIKIAPARPLLERLKGEGRVLILDFQDMFLFPTAHERNPLKRVLKRIYYRNLEKEEKRRYSLFDLCFVASPAAEEIVRRAGMKPYFLFRQIYNDWNRENPKRHSDRTRGITIIWTGVTLNLPQNRPVEPVLEDICRRYDSRVLYLTQKEGREGFIEYRKWSLDRWERDLLEGDIAFRWHDNSNIQYLKDSNKVISYMAAGLPVVCRPTASDMTVIEEGVTGFFARSPEEFGRIVERLITNPSLRKEIGERAHREVWKRYSLERHVAEMKKVMVSLLNGRAR